jgi:hypothetical protein
MHSRVRENWWMRLCRWKWQDVCRRLAGDHLLAADGVEQRPCSQNLLDPGQRQSGMSD